jgi:membrane protein DedA with SNARE-associated domain
VGSSGELYVYVGTFLAIVATGLGVPIPEEIPIVAGGVLAGQHAEKPHHPVPAQVVGLLAADPAAGLPGAVPWYEVAQKSMHPNSFHVRWWVLLPLCILAVVLGDGCLYFLGRKFGPRLLDLPLLKRLLSPEHRDHIERNFHRYGIKILLFARLLPGIRSPIFLTAGIMRLPLKRFLLADGIYAIPGVSLLFFLAFWFGNSFKELVDRATMQIRHIVIVVAIVGVAIYFLVHFLRRPVTEGDPKELPLIGEQVAAASVEPGCNGDDPSVTPTGPDNHVAPGQEKTDTVGEQHR